MTSRQPTPPSNWKSLDGNVREDLRRIRLYLEELNDWLSDNAGDPGALTTAAGDLRYLLRGANDFTTFTSKTTPTSSDVMLLEDAAASYAKKKVTLGQLGFASNYGSGAVPLWVPPAARGATPGGIDDEFDSTTINPAWVFRDITTGPTNRTPNFGALTENVNLTGAATVPNVSLHTQGRRSYMLVQTTTTGPANYWIYKPLTWAAGQVYWAGFGHTVRQNGTTSGSGNYGLCIWASSGGLPDANNRMYIGFDPGTGPASYRYTVVAGGVATTQNLLVTEGWGLFPYLALVNPANVLGASATWYGELFNDFGQRVQPSGTGTLSPSWTPAFVGWTYAQTFVAPAVFAVDFIRETAGHPLFHV